MAVEVSRPTVAVGDRTVGFPLFGLDDDVQPVRALARRRSELALGQDRQFRSPGSPHGPLFQYGILNVGTMMVRLGLTTTDIELLKGRLSVDFFARGLDRAMEHSGLAGPTPKRRRIRSKGGPTL